MILDKFPKLTPDEKPMAISSNEEKKLIDYPLLKFRLYRLGYRETFQKTLKPIMEMDKHWTPAMLFTDYSNLEFEKKEQIPFTVDESLVTKRYPTEQPIMARRPSKTPAPIKKFAHIGDEYIDHLLLKIKQGKCVEGVRRSAALPHPPLPTPERPFNFIKALGLGPHEEMIPPPTSHLKSIPTLARKTTVDIDYTLMTGLQGVQILKSRPLVQIMSHSKYIESDNRFRINYLAQTKNTKKMKEKSTIIVSFVLEKNLNRLNKQSQDDVVNRKKSLEEKLASNDGLSTDDRENVLSPTKQPNKSIILNVD
jgi:hypothetical protein